MNITRTYENIQRRNHADVALVCELVAAKHYNTGSGTRTARKSEVYELTHLAPRTVAMASSTGKGRHFPSVGGVDGLSVSPMPWYVWLTNQTRSGHALRAVILRPRHQHNPWIHYAPGYHWFWLYHVIQPVNRLHRLSLLLLWA